MVPCFDYHCVCNLTTLYLGGGCRKCNAEVDGKCVASEYHVKQVVVFIVFCKLRAELARSQQSIGFTSERLVKQQATIHLSNTKSHWLSRFYNWMTFPTQVLISCQRIMPPFAVHSDKALRYGHHKPNSVLGPVWRTSGSFRRLFCEDSVELWIIVDKIVISEAIFIATSTWSKFHSPPLTMSLPSSFRVYF